MAYEARNAHNNKLVQDMYQALNIGDYVGRHRYWHEDMIWHGPWARRAPRPRGPQAQLPQPQAHGQGDPNAILGLRSVKDGKPKDSWLMIYIIDVLKQLGRDRLAMVLPLALAARNR